MSKKNKLKREIKKTTLVTKKTNIFSELIIPVLIFFTTLFITSYFAHLGSDQHSDGILFKPALDVANGQMLFRDTFTQYGALTTLLQSLSIKVFGPFLINIRLQTAFFYALSSVMLWLIWKKFLPKLLALISIIIWILLAPYYIWPFIPWSSVYALFFQLLSTYLLIKYFEKNKKYLLLFSGLTAALTFWCRQPVGVFLVFFTSICLIYLFLIKKIKIINLLTYYIGSICISFVFFIWLFINNAFNDWWIQSIKQAYSFGKSFNGQISPLKIISALFPGSPNMYPSLIWSILPISIFFVLLIIIFKTKNNQENSNKTIIINKDFSSKETTIFILSIISIGSWLQYYPVSCIRHVYWASTPTIALFIYLIWYLINFIFLKNKNSDLIQKIIIFIIVISIVFWKDIKTRVIIGINRSTQKTMTVNKPTVLKDIKYIPQEAYFYSTVSYIIDTYLNSHPGTNLITNGIDALTVTLTNKTENYDPLYINWPSFSYLYPNHEKNMNLYIQKNHPLIIGSFTPAEKKLTLPENYCYLKDSNNNPIDLFMVPCGN